MKLSSILVVLGTIISTIAAAGINKPLMASKNVPLLLLFTLGMIALIASTFFRKRELKAEVEKLESTGILDPEGVTKEITDRLKALLDRVNSLETSGADKKVEKAEEAFWLDVRDEVERILLEVILPLMDMKELLKEKLGAERYGEFAVEFAYGERYLNRAWSAITDEYYWEAKESITEALDGFKRALDTLK